MSGDEAGTYMLKGDLVVVGNAGNNFANYLIRGMSIWAGNARVTVITRNSNP